MKKRIITTAAVAEAVRAACIRANGALPPDVLRALENALAAESSPAGRAVLGQILDNARLAAESGLPLCQDTGLAVIFVELGEDAVLDRGPDGLGLYAAINRGVRQGYADGFLRKSVCDPFSRANSGDNTPAVIHTGLVPGDGLKLTLLAKGGGSENMSRVTMLTPAEGWTGVKKFVLERVAEAGSNPCPPIIIGLGVGGSFESAPLLAKKALLLPLDQSNPDPDLAAREAELLTAVNRLGIGPMGLGGDVTALGVRILAAPCHIASLPLAVNVQCHSARHLEIEL